MSFANRTREIAEFKKFAAARAPVRRIVFFRTARATGASEFLRHLAATGNRNAIHIYMDMATGNLGQIADALKDQRDRSLAYRLGNFMRAGPVMALLARIMPIATALLSPLTRVGATALAGLGEGILIEPFPSLATSRICRMAVTWPRPDVFLLLDNAQEKAREVLQLAQACASDAHYAHVKFVLAITDESGGDLRYEDFRRRMPFPASMMHEVAFGPIDASFVAALAAVRGWEIERADCERLALAADNDLWRLLACLDNSEQQEELRPTSIFLLRSLSIAAQPIRISDLRLLVLRSSQVMGTPELIDEAIAQLQRRQLIELHSSEDGERVAALVTTSALPVREITGNGVANLSVARDLYEFFSAAEASGSARHSKSALALLLYRLAQQIDPANVPRRAQRLVDAAMSQGSLDEAERYIEAARRREGIPSIHDLFVQIALYVSLQDYAAAKEVLNQCSSADFTRYRVLRILDAVALNRVRRHDESKQCIDALLNESSTLEEKALLVSYEIGGLLHEERWNEARDVWSKWADRLRTAENYPYLLRNAAAVHMLPPAHDLSAAIRLLEDALARFTSNGDAFGEATTRCNYGVAQAYTRDMIAASNNFQRSYDFLSILGTQHIQEAGTNLGTSLMLLGQYDRARIHMMKILPMMETNYPSIITATNLAMLDLIAGDGRAASARLRALIVEAEEVRILDCWRHVQFASVVAASVTGNGGHAVALIDELERRGGPSRRAVRLREAVTRGPIGKHEVLAHYRADWMQYWSQNPLKMLPVATLTT